MTATPLLGLGERLAFSAAEAAKEGVSPFQLRQLAGRGEIMRVRHGWYTFETGADPERLHLIRTVAAVAATGGAAAASHHSAVLLHGLPLVDTRLDEVLLHRGDKAGHGVVRGQSRVTYGPGRRGEVEIPRWPRPVAVVEIPDAVVQTAMLNGPRAGLVAADAAMHGRALTAEQLEESLHRFRHHRGIGPARAALGHADGRHESAGESLTAIVLRGMGVSFVPQREVAVAGRLYRTDFYVEEYDTIVEFDGAGKYADRADLVAEKVREDDLRALGHGFVRLVWDEVYRRAVGEAKLWRAFRGR